MVNKWFFPPNHCTFIIRLSKQNSEGLKNHWKKGVERVNLAEVKQISSPLFFILYIFVLKEFYVMMWWKITPVTFLFLWSWKCTAGWDMNLPKKIIKKRWCVTPFQRVSFNDLFPLQQLDQYIFHKVCCIGCVSRF